MLAEPLHLRGPISSPCIDKAGHEHTPAVEHRGYTRFQWQVNGFTTDIVKRNRPLETAQAVRVAVNAHPSSHKNAHTKQDRLTKPGRG